MEWVGFSALRGKVRKAFTVDAENAEAAVLSQWPGREIEWDEDDPRYFSLVSPPGGPLTAGRVTKLPFA